MCQLWALHVVIKRFFTFILVSIMGLTRCYKTFFYIYSK